MSAISIVIADDHPLFRQALVEMIRKLYPAVDLTECNSICELHTVLNELTPNLVLLDLSLSDSEGFHGLLAMQTLFPDIPVAIVSASEDNDIVDNSIIFGARGFIPKSSSIVEFQDALTKLLAGKKWTPSDFRAKDIALSIQDNYCLSPKQFQILSGLQRGLMNKQIAHELGVTEATVKSHFTLLFRKLGVQTRTQALLLTGHSIKL